MKPTKKQLAVIGCGGRLSSVLSQIFYLEQPVEVTAILDHNPDYSRQCLAKHNISTEAIRYYTTEEEFWANEHPDGILIGTNCNSHAYYAEQVLKRGIPLFLEKPVGINEEDLARLEPYAATNTTTVVSFPLRVTELCQQAKKILDSGVLGKISQVQAVNNVPYGRGYFKKWYRNDSITGGLFLQKATHDIDTILYLLGDKVPSSVIGVSTKNILVGDRPAGLRCHDCEDYLTCPESTYVLTKFCNEPEQPDTCSFAVDTGNEDSGTMILMFPDGMHAVYTQNFVARKEAGKRMVRIIGMNATLEFNFVTGVLTLYHHYKDSVETYTAKSAGGHFGGDHLLARSYLSLLNEGKPVLTGTLADGVLSAKICLLAKRSAEQGGTPHFL